MMDIESEVLKWIVLGALSGWGWWLRTSITKLQDDVEKIKAEYLHKDDFKEFKLDLFRALDAIQHDIRKLISFKDSE